MCELVCASATLFVQIKQSLWERLSCCFPRSVALTIGGGGARIKSNLVHRHTDTDTQTQTQTVMQDIEVVHRLRQIVGTQMNRHKGKEVCRFK